MVWDIVRNQNNFSGFSFAFAPEKSGSNFTSVRKMGNTGVQVAGGITGSINVEFSLREIYDFISGEN